MNFYERKQEAKRARLEAAADRAKREADASFAGARSALAGIEFGQPILVGHHSEKHHRAAIKRSDARMRKAFEATERAKELTHRALSVGSGGISSDDPDALAKLTDKRTDLERQRDHMKAVNAAYRKKDSPTLVALTGKTLEEWTAAVAGNFSWDKQPYASYTLTNIGARIRQAAKRAETVEANAEVQRSEETVGDATIVVDPDDNRVTVAFTARLSKEHYKLMRSRGFVWSPTRSGFTRKMSGSALYHAREVAQMIAKETAA